MKVGTRDIPYLCIEFPEGGEKRVPLTGVRALGFFRRVKSAAGFSEKSAIDFYDHLREHGQKVAFDEEQIGEAVCFLLPNDIKEKFSDPETGELLLTSQECMDMFLEAWFKINGSWEESGDPESKKSNGSVE